MMDKPGYMPVHRVGQWLGEMEVLDALQSALNEAVGIHGNAAKAFAWDVSHSFKRRIGCIPTPAESERQQGDE